MIPNRPPPRLRSADRWSADFIDFVANCLIKDPESRPTAKELLGHPFVRDAAAELSRNRGSSEVLKHMVERLVVRREELARKRKEMKASNVADFGKTVVKMKNAGAKESDFGDSGTIVE